MPALLAIVAIAACGDSAASSTDVTGPDAGGDAQVDGAPASCTAPTEAPTGLDAYLADHVAKLSGTQDISPGARLTDRGTPENRRAARTYLNDQLAALGLATSIDDYGEGANVVGRLAATAEGATEWIVVGAHFDSEVGSPGANDNATGVAAVLAVARALKDVPCRSRGVMFVMFDQEEVGLLGSKAFVQRERTAATEIVAAHTIDQVGWDADGDRTFEIELPTPALFAEYQAGATAVGVKVVETKTSGTDHQALRARGYAAAGITEEYVAGDTSPHRHLLGDAPSTVQTGYQALAARLVIYVVARELGAQ
jgi:acetylornithine deacetylase/succinyl-diaminopimelate desuccinylase-like protein